MTTTSVHEAWCAHCRVTHPPGTKRCLHCGSAVLPARPEGGGGMMGTFARTNPTSPFPPDPGVEEEAEPARAARPLKMGMTAIWIALAVATAILRSCSERG